MPKGGISLQQFCDYSDRDELKARFTSWLLTLTYRVRNRYLEKKGSEPALISIEDVPRSLLPASDPFGNIEEQSSFEFEEERLSAAFRSLTLKRQQILTMLFVEELKPEEIARRLNCSVQYVYDQRYHALKRLRMELEKDGDAQ